MPVDFDRSPKSDLGYSGWVQFPDGEIYIAGYIVDDWPRAQIRGYAFGPDEFLLPAT
jgi:sialidase-1